jgi:hypothetical protein
MDDAVKSALTALLADVRLDGVTIHGLEVRRRTDQPPEEMESTIGQAFRADESSFGYRTTFTLDNEALFLEVVISADYELPNAEAILREDQELQSAFGQQIALPAVWPFIRQRTWDLSASVGLKPVLVPMWLSDAVLQPVNDDEAGDEGGSP